jgi:hypothetical protein
MNSEHIANEKKPSLIVSTLNGALLGLIIGGITLAVVYSLSNIFLS